MSSVSPNTPASSTVPSGTTVTRTTNASSQPSSSTSSSTSNNNNSSTAIDTTTTSNNNTNNDDNDTGGPLQADELSRRMFLGGLFGLPWLWIVHTLYWYGKQRGMDDGRQLHDSSQSNDAESREQSEILLAERMWVKRCRNSAIFATATWIAWVLIIQVLLTDYFPDSWFVAQDNVGEATGW